MVKYISHTKFSLVEYLLVASSVLALILFSTVGCNRSSSPPIHEVRSEEVSFSNTSDEVSLKGTLTYPADTGPQPAVVLLAGMGQNRNAETGADHAPFSVLARHLTQQGFVVLRYDKRGVGASKGTYGEVTLEGLARDAAAALSFLKNHPRTQAGTTGLLGLSEGGLTAPITAVQHEPVSYLVLLSAPSVPYHELSVAQRVRIDSARGATALDSIRSAHRRQVDVIREAPDSATIAKRLRSVLQEQGASQKRIQSLTESATRPHLRSLMKHDPQPVLRRVDVPTLALYGGNDLHVPPQQNAGPMRSALKESPTEDVTVQVLEGLNHLLQPAKTGLPEEVRASDTTFSPKALDKITGWIEERTRKHD